MAIIIPVIILRLKNFLDIETYVSKHNSIIIKLAVREILT